MNENPKKYKIRLNNKEVNHQEIKEFKDFNRVLRQYRRVKKPVSLHQSLLKINKLLPVLIVVILIILIVFYYERVVRKLKQSPEKLPQNTELYQPIFFKKLANLLPFPDYQNIEGSNWSHRASHSSQFV